MITEALSHCRGIGPVRLSRLHAAGIRTWQDVLEHPDRLPASLRNHLVDTCRRSLAAFEADDIGWLLQHLVPRDRWRVLACYFSEATFFDIETTGLEYDATITTIACWHRQQLHHFVEHENLDDFLDVLHESRLLISFNGAGFDVPRVLDGFHIPELPCPHLDLRWSCYHRGLSGSLKSIASGIGIRRPRDLETADGALAVLLWSHWQRARDPAARQLLLRYCASDVLLLLLVAQHLCGRAEHAADDLWFRLPPEVPLPEIAYGNTARSGSASVIPAQDSSSTPAQDAAAAVLNRQTLLNPLFGPGSPAQLRTLPKREQSTSLKQ